MRQNMLVSKEELSNVVGEEQVSRFIELWEDFDFDDNTDARIGLEDWLMGVLPLEEDEESEEYDESETPRGVSSWDELSELWDTISIAYKKSNPNCIQLECRWEEDDTAPAGGRVVFEY